MTLPGSWDEDWFSSPAVYDLGGDGNMAIIAGRHSVLYVWNGDGTHDWSAPVGENATPTIVHGSSRQYASPVVGDLTQDGIPEIVFSTYPTVQNVSHLIMLDATGTLLHKLPLAKRGSMNVPTLADVDGEEIIEILVSLKDTIGGGIGGVQIYDVSTAASGYFP